MENYIMVGCDLHDKSMMLKIAYNREPARTKTYRATMEARERMLDDLERLAREMAGAEVVFAYEACAQGFGLYDQVKGRGFQCHVLAPTKLPQSVRSRRDKCDEKDAQRALDVVRGHVLGGNELPAVWVPDHETRDDREIMRTRLDVSEKTVRVRNQIVTLTKRNAVVIPSEVGNPWTKRYMSFLHDLSSKELQLRIGARIALASLLRQLKTLEEELRTLDEAVAHLARTDRYQAQVRELTKACGVGVLTAMVFLSEMGKLDRFQNRKDIGAYLGLATSHFDTGESDRKGHITRQGSPRVRKVLCQAVWTRIRYDEQEKAWYDRVTKRNPKRNRIAVVGAMRRLAIRMWHVAQSATPTAPPLPSPPKGGKRQPSPSGTLKTKKNGRTHSQKGVAPALPSGGRSSRPALRQS